MQLNTRLLLLLVEEAFQRWSQMKVDKGGRTPTLPPWPLECVWEFQKEETTKEDHSRKLLYPKKIKVQHNSGTNICILSIMWYSVPPRPYIKGRLKRHCWVLNFKTVWHYVIRINASSFKSNRKCFRVAVNLYLNIRVLMCHDFSREFFAKPPKCGVTFVHCWCAPRLPCFRDFMFMSHFLTWMCRPGQTGRSRFTSPRKSHDPGRRTRTKRDHKAHIDTTGEEKYARPCHRLLV